MGSKFFLAAAITVLACAGGANAFLSTAPSPQLGSWNKKSTSSTHRHANGREGTRGATCQLNSMVESLFGVKRSAQYHEERALHHEERLAYHRAELAKLRGERSADIQKQRATAGSGSWEARAMQKARNEARPLSICFVDLSNTCRSPAAAAILRSRVAALGLTADFEVRSRSTGAGVRDWFKDEMRTSIETVSYDPRMLSHASKRGLSAAFPSLRASAPISRDDLTADIIVCMDQSNEREVLAAANHWGVKGVDGRTRLLTTYCRSGTRTTDIPDPYYGAQGSGQGGKVFDKVLDLIEDGCKGLVRDLCPDSA
ncbi:phosphotyrosine protein phosphatase I superfamily [Baffinella frigidus]|nr:phosphotyrosine protein phosphatase I superfamily [Cryptophyta sp. CCMP2293]